MECPVFRVKFRKGSLASHLATQYGVYHSHLLTGADTCQPMGESRTFWARHLPAEGVWQCPVPDCPLGREGRGGRVKRPCAYTLATAIPTTVWA